MTGIHKKHFAIHPDLHDKGRTILIMLIDLCLNFRSTHFCSKKFKYDEVSRKLSKSEYGW